MIQTIKKSLVQIVFSKTNPKTKDSQCTKSIFPILKIRVVPIYSGERERERERENKHLKVPDPNFFLISKMAKYLEEKSIAS